ncbi:hypothetical protein [Kingella sp. (in: b-proteobacteria)]|uniref:hypothetical protein n=1 Tax=Kingella sp. (in: b-proteobacteria) TaxID=2020713 RepID=UPI0026DAEAA9|nr:hypothetical protein [Kingella sp. (in: b-proteobacteria)]MDO4656442.1 hypothetical protein [Kingella sp. (in: b-proteobacteria)]
MFTFDNGVLKKAYFGSIWRVDKGCAGIKNVKIAPNQSILFSGCLDGVGQPENCLTIIFRLL